MSLARLIRPLSYLIVAALLLSSTLGHSFAMTAHALDHGARLAQVIDPMHQSPVSSQCAHGDLGACEHRSHSACGSGHCCFPVPASEVFQAQSQQTPTESRLVATYLTDGWLDPPPPKLSS